MLLSSVVLLRYSYHFWIMWFCLYGMWFICSITFNWYIAFVFKNFLSCKYRAFASEPVAYLYFWYPEVWTDMEAHLQPTNNLSSSNNVQTVLSQTSTIPIRFCEINIEWKKCCRSEKERERERMHCLTATNHLFLEGIAVVVIVWYFYLQLPVL